MTDALQLMRHTKNIFALFLNYLTVANSSYVMSMTIWCPPQPNNLFYRLSIRTRTEGCHSGKLYVFLCAVWACVCECVPLLGCQVIRKPVHARKQQMHV